MRVSQFRFVASSCPAQSSGDPHETVLGVYLAVNGDVFGHIAFLLPWSSAHKLWVSIASDAPSEPQVTERLFVSEVVEVGSAIGHLCTTALREATGLALFATPPLVSVDARHNILESIMAGAREDEFVELTVETDPLVLAPGTALGCLLHIPSSDGRARLCSLLGTKEAA
ncbi:MAG: hypothetical protein JSS66_18515 [Armatimonadetes bacterium]|nr:hypothetical protein [Armatimonadota bacterium]